MQSITLDTLKELKGLNKLPELKLRYKLSDIKSKPLDDTTKRVKLLRKLFDNDTFDIREEAIVILLGSESIPMGYFSMSKGTKNSVRADFHYLFQMLILSGAEGFIYAHNHPVGTTRPSEADFDFTHALLAQSRFMGFDFLDHIILTKKKHFSFDDNILLW